MDVVAFAVGNRPQVDDGDARDLAGSLRLRRNHAATQVAGKIHAELEKTADARSAIVLTVPQLEELVDVLTEDLPKMPQERRR